MALSCVGMASSAVLAYAACALLGIGAARSSVSWALYARVLVPIGLSMAVMFYLGNLCYLYLPGCVPVVMIVMCARMCSSGQCHNGQTMQIAIWAPAVESYNAILCGAARNVGQSTPIRRRRETLR